MKQFLLRLFAVVGILSSLVFLLVSLIISSFVENAAKEPEPPENIVLYLDFTKPIGERIKGYSFGLSDILYGEEEQTSLLAIVRAIENAKNDNRVKGIAARLGSETIHLIHAQEIANALKGFRESGKFSHIFAPSYGDFASGGTSYFLASQFETIWLQPVGSVGLTGLGIEAPFGKSALQELGIKADVLRREEYKSVMENVSGDAFSPSVKDNLSKMLLSLSGQISFGISQGRKIDIARAEDWVKNGPFTSKEALNAGMVSKLGYLDEVEKEIKEKGGKDVAFLPPETYLHVSNQYLKVEPKGQIAVIYAEGVISDAPPDTPSSLADEQIIDTEEVVSAFEDAAEDKEIKAIIFRVNSPGGSPVASETIRRALIKAKENKKPVIVSMGQVAASGGYWIAMNGDKIIANPATITGSIGVISGKFVVGGLYDKLKLKWDTIETHGNTHMWSTRTSFDAHDRDRLNAMLDETYDAFVSNVSSARNIPSEKMPDVAKGRVFTGEQALQVGLVDELGGMETAIEAAKQKVGLTKTDKLIIRQFPPPETPATIAIKLLKEFKTSGAMFRSSLQDLNVFKKALSPYIDLSAFTNPASTKLPTYYTFE